jgi:hypothetical protein
VPLQVMLPRFWVASTKPEAALVLGRRVIAGQRQACIAWRGAQPVTTVSVGLTPETYPRPGAAYAR